MSEEAETQPELLREAPHAAPIRRLVEAPAGRKPALRPWDWRRRAAHRSRGKPVNCDPPRG